MGRKIFISYKYKDNNVQNLSGIYSKTIVRDYLNELKKIFKYSEHILKAEHDDEDLSVNKSNTYITSNCGSLPDQMGSYSYYINAQECCPTGCIKYKSDVTFEIITKNMFNLKEPDIKICTTNSTIH